MPGHESTNHSSAERELFRKVADEALSADEFACLEERLLADREFRFRLVQYLDLEANIYAELSDSALPDSWHDIPRDEQAIVSPARSTTRNGWRTGWGWMGLGLLAAAAALAAIAVIYGLPVRLGSTQVAHSGPTQQGSPAKSPGLAVQEREGSPGGEGSGYVEAQLQGMEVAAIVTHAESLEARVRGTRLSPGVRLKPGSLVLREGRVQLEFLGGAKLLAEGPCELHILTPKSATLVSGKAATRVLEWGKGFVLNTPETALVDLGTEFAVAVDDERGSEVRVTVGEVEVSLLGDDGNTLTSERVVESKSLAVRPGATHLESSDGEGLAEMTLLETPMTPLAVPPQYVQVVRGAEPTAYWRFEEISDGHVPNEMTRDYPARIVAAALDEEAIGVADGALRLRSSTGSRYLVSAAPIERFNAESFSVEMWLNPEMLHWATLASVVPEGDTTSLEHLNVLELAHQTNLVHTAGAFRFMHRHPPFKKGGVNAFTKRGCTPGQWHHFVAVKTPTELRCYVNGVLDRTLPDSLGSDALAYEVFFGQLRKSTSERQFVGALDEIAIYLHELDDATVQLHYDAMYGASAP
ncbi:MAG: LamG domain-containing protein [Pirellulaceae bacterium]|nr:LamG domain-containing protein [Pirellulaceae bacterium]